MKISTRINGRVTSVKLKDSICALHYLILGSDERIYEHCLDTCHTLIGKWRGDSARGLSTYISDKMIEEIIQSNDLLLAYQEALECLQDH